MALFFGQLEAYIWAEYGRTYHLWGDWNCAISAYNCAFSVLSSAEHKKEIFACCLHLQLESWLNEILLPQSSNCLEINW